MSNLTIAVSGNNVGQPQHKAFTGRVTKLLDNFGFVDDDVFFQLSVVRGGNVKIGDQVYVDCQYSEHLPFKWNAIGVQVLPQQASAVACNSTYLPQNNSLPLPREQHQNAPPQQPYYSRELPQNHPANIMQTQPPAQIQQQRERNPVFQSEYKQAPNNQQAALQSQPQNYQEDRYYNKPQASATSYSSNQQQITYTSTPGSAFVSTAFVPQQPVVPQQPPQPVPNQKFTAFKGASRWEPQRRDELPVAPPPRPGPPEMRRDDHRRDHVPMRDHAPMRRDEARDVPMRPIDRERKDRERERERERERDREREGSQSGRGDRFGRDKERSEREKDIPIRPRRSESPMSTTSSNVSSRLSKRRYEVANLPKHSILKEHLSICDIKSRYGSGLHIPSDFKEVLVNSSFRMNIQEIPKPIKYRILAPKVLKSEQAENGIKEEEAMNPPAAPDSIKTEENIKTETDELAIGTLKTENVKEEEAEIPMDTSETESPKSKGAKYGVKVLLLAMPSLSEIMDRVFGSDRDNQVTSKSYFVHINKLITFLASRNYNDGYSLIGGKFNVVLDGFYDDTSTPNLIETAKRCVKEQTGIDLSRCKRWKNIGTFIYDRDDSLVPDAALEYSCIYMPDVWTLLENEVETNLSGTILNNDSNINLVAGGSVAKVESNDDDNNLNIEQSQKTTSSEAENSENLSVASVAGPSTSTAYSLVFESSDQQPLSPKPPQQQDDIADPLLNVSASDTSDLNSSMLVIADDQPIDSSTILNPLDISNLDSATAPQPNDEQAEKASVQEKLDFLQRVVELKVTELKSELDKRDVKYARTAKKAELLAKLKEIVQREIAEEDVVSDAVKGDWWAHKIRSQEEKDKNDVNVSTESVDATDQAVNLTTSQSSSEASTPAVKQEPSDVVAQTGSSGSVEASPEKGKMNVLQETIPEELVLVVVKVEKRKLENGSIGEGDGEEKFSKRICSTSTPAKNEPTTVVNQSTSIAPPELHTIDAFGDRSLSVISLHQGLSRQKYDHFELTITAELIREALSHHFANYILSSLVHNKPLPSSKNATDLEIDRRKTIINNYVQLAFSFFDSNHCGYLLADDLVKILHNCGFMISKKGWTSVVGDNDKILYRSLQEPSTVMEYTPTKPIGEDDSTTRSSKEPSVYIRNGNVYEIPKLIDQSEKDEKIKAEQKEKLTTLQEKLDQQQQQVEEFESRQKKMTSAISKQNDEICALKRDKESFRVKYEDIRTGIEGSVSTFTDMLKKHKEEQA